MAVKEFELGLRKVTVLHRSNGESGHGLIVMHAISEKEENDILMASLEVDDKGKPVGKPTYVIAGKEFKGPVILAYGEMNLKSPVCLDLIEKMPIVSPEVFGNSNWMPSNYDFARRVVTTLDDGVVRWSQTWDKVKWFKYHYSLIGNPKRVIVYRVDGHDLEKILKVLGEE